MLRLSRNRKEPLSDSKSAERWIDTFARADPLGAQAEIVRQLRPLAQPSTHRSVTELEALFLVDRSVDSVRQALVAQYTTHAARSSKVEAKLWQALLELTHGFELAYAAFAREIRRRAYDPRWQQQLPELLVRSMRQLAFESRIRMFRYEQWIPGKWREVHELFRLACAHRVARRKVRLVEDAEPTTVERQYLGILVLQLANAGNLKPAHVEWLWQQIEGWCAPLKLKITVRSPNAFYVDLSEAKGLARRADAVQGGEVLFLDTHPLSALLNHYMLAVEQKIRDHPLSSNTARRIERLGILRKVAAQVDGQFTPIPRRGERTNASGEVDVILGLDRISGFIRAPERVRVNEADTVSTFSGTLDLAVFGHSRTPALPKVDAAQKRLAEYACSGGPWEVKDVSATGLRLIAPIAAAQGLTLGTLAALRGVGHSAWALGIVRRVRRLTAERAEIGVQRIADTISAVELLASRATADPEAPAPERRVRGLLLALHPVARTRAVQSLVLPRAPDGEGAGQHRYRAPASSATIRLGRTIEEQPEWIWVAVEPQGSKTTQAPAAVAG